MMYKLILYVIYLVNNAICFGESIKYNTLIDIVNDLEITNNKYSSSIISLLCYSQGDNVKLSSMLIGVGYKYAAVNNVNHINSHLDTNAHHTIFFADVKCSGFNNNIYQANKNNLFALPFRWIIFGGEDKGNASIVPRDLINSNILIDSEVLVIFSSGNETFLLYSVFKARANTFWRTEFYGTWSKEKGLNKTNEMSIPTTYRRLGLTELNIRVNYVILKNDTFKYLNNYKNNHLDSVTRVGYWSTNALLDFMRCNRTHIFTDNWGFYINNSWTGLTGSLSRDECDLGGTPMFKLKKRLPYVKYLTSPIRTKVMFLFRQPPLSYEHNLYVLAFTNLVWVSILGLIVILVITLFISAYWEYKRRLNMCLTDVTLEANVSDITILIFGAMCQQGSSVELKSSIGRVVMLTLFLISTFLYTSYSANIVVLRQSSATNIRTLKDLLDSKLDLGVEDMNYNYYYFSTATDPIRKAIYETKIAPKGKKPQFYTLEEGVKKIKDEPFAFNMELGTGFKFVERYFYEGEKCGLTEIAYLDEQDPLLTCQKHSPFHEIFKIGLLRVEEHGINSRNVNLLYTKKPKCLSRGGNFVSVSFRDSYPALLIFGYGVLSAFAILILENVLYRIRK